MYVCVVLTVSCLTIYFAHTFIIKNVHVTRELYCIAFLVFFTSENLEFYGANFFLCVTTVLLLIYSALNDVLDILIIMVLQVMLQEMNTVLLCVVRVN